MTVDVVVVGGGIAGLATAYELSRRGIRFVVLEHAPRAGGVILSEEVDGFAIDGGPDALLIQKPTNNKDDLIAALDRLQLDRHTAIGSGIVMALATLFPDEGIDLESMVLGSRQSWRTNKPPEKKAEKKEVKSVPPGSNTSSAIVLLTDGRRTTGPDPLDAARMAADHGIRVFTVGFGSPAGGPAMMDGYSIYMAYDEATLKSIAELTEAEYFHAASADELKRVYQALSGKFVLAKEEREVTALAAALAALLTLAAGGLSLAWFNRL